MDSSGIVGNSVKRREGEAPSEPPPGHCVTRGSHGGSPSRQCRRILCLGGQSMKSRQRGQREIVPVEVVLQIENPRETGAGVKVLFPCAVFGLGFTEPADRA